MKPVTEYLSPSSTIDADHPAIQERAAELTRGIEDPAERSVRLFYWVRDSIKYTPLVPLEIFDGYRASATMERESGFCVEKGALLAALARASGIPARVRLADIRNHQIPERLMAVMTTNLFSCHGLSELHINGRWVKATPAFDRAMCEENRIRPVEFDAGGDAVLHSHTLDGGRHIEYVRDRGHYLDVPVDLILKDWMSVYGPDTIERARKYLEEMRP
jgi:transglutaminase-like putative cysteine protease